MSVTANEDSSRGKVAVIGVPSSAGARQIGQERAPQALRRAGLIEALQATGLHVIDLGDLPRVVFKPDPKSPRQQNLALVCDVAKRVAGQVDAAVKKWAKPIVVGGDCTITLGVLSGLIRHFRDIGLIYFDGDVDLHTPEDTASGIFDGMGMAHIIGVGAQELSGIGPRYPLMPQERIVLFGYNHDSGWIDPAESARLERCVMHKYPVGNVRPRTKESAQEALVLLEDGAAPFLVHFDVDVIDENDFPVADVPHKHGFTFRDAVECLRLFVRSTNFAGLVITEFNAERDVDGVFAKLLADAIAVALGDGQTQWRVMSL